MNWPDDFINKIICGDCLEVMKEMPDESIDMALTSPPYWGLRDYGFEYIFGGDPDCEHKWDKKIKKWHSDRGTGSKKEIYDDTFQVKGTRDDTCLKCQAWKGQLGLEPTPELYIEHLTKIFNELKRILKKEGTLWLNMGDTYWSAKGTCFNPGGGKNSIETKRREIYPLNRGNKSDVPNLPQKSLTMIPERLAWTLIQNGWILRNKIPWIKPNCMPSSAKDRYTNKWEYVFYFVKSQRNYFDLDSVREPHKESSIKRDEQGYKSSPMKGRYKIPWEQREGTRDQKFNNPRGKNPGDVWIISTQPCPFKDVHFATFPEKLCKKAIIPGSPEDGIVLDPFCGVGTALYVAKQLRRRFIGIDIKNEYCERAEKRLAQGVL